MGPRPGGQRCKGATATATGLDVAGRDTAVAAGLDVLPAVVRVLSQATAAPGQDGRRLTLTQFRVLKQLCERRLLGSDLAMRLELTPATISAAIDGLVRAGMVDRHRSEGDRRAVPLEITAAGQSALAAARSRQQDALTDLLDGLSPRERRCLSVGLRGLVRAMEERRAR